MITVGLIVAASSCSGSDDDSISPGDDTEYTSQEMGFNVSTRPMSRAAIEGETFPTTRTVHATSIYHSEDGTGHHLGFYDPWPTVSNNGGTKVEDLTFRYDTDKEAWAGSPSQYWPAEGTMDFAAWSTETYVPTATWAYDSYSKITGLTLDFTGSSSQLDGTHDVLYSDITAGITCPQKTPVPLLMRHALAWISFEVDVDLNVTNVDEDDEAPITYFNVNKVTLNDVYLTGKATCSLKETEYDTDGTTIIDGSTVSWSPMNDKKTYVISNLEEGVLIVPGEKTTCTVDYDVTIGTVISKSLTAEVSLKVTSDTDPSDNWKAGVHYIYTITIRAKEITLIPKVKAWDKNTANVVIPAF